MTMASNGALRAPLGGARPIPADRLELWSASLRRRDRRCLFTVLPCAGKRPPADGVVLGNRPSDADQRSGPLDGPARFNVRR
jgi:hypothetical protein